MRHIKHSRKIRRRKSKQSQTRKQTRSRKYNMKGCSKGASCIGQTGGCGCSVMSGGSRTFWDPMAPEVGGIAYKMNSYDNQVDRVLFPTRTILGGAKSKKRLNKKMRKSLRGGGLIPQELLNFRNDINSSFSNVYTSLKGVDPMVSPAVYKDQYSKPV
jgi:hypothetical protein